MATFAVVVRSCSMSDDISKPRRHPIQLLAIARLELESARKHSRFPILLFIGFIHEKN